MKLEGILSRFERVHRSGKGWIARCPAHEDRNPSLSILEADGKVLIHCHAGCKAEDVCAALGLSIRDLFASPGQPQMLEPPAVRAARRAISDLRSRLTPQDRERGVTVIFADSGDISPAIARALALAIEGEIVQLALMESER